MSSEKPEIPRHPKEAPCPLCGGTRFTWGEALGYRKRQVRFKSSLEGFFSEGDVVEARKCNNCGNIQMFGK